MAPELTTPQKRQFVRLLRLDATYLYKIEYSFLFYIFSEHKMSEPSERIQLVCTPTKDCSILSVLRNGWDSITEVYTHPLLRFFTMEETAQLRCICSEFVDAVSIAPFKKLRNIIPSLYWCECFPNANVKTLHVYRRDMYVEDAAALAVALPSLKMLTALYLEATFIGAAGATLLAATLPNLSALTDLELSSNNIGDAGATALAGALVSLPALTALDLCDNKIGDAGATALAGALVSLPALTVLDLSDNTIGDAGATALAGALPFLPALTALYMTTNHISGTVIAAIRAAAGCFVGI